MCHLRKSHAYKCVARGCTYVFPERVEKIMCESIKAKGLPWASCMRTVYEERYYTAPVSERSTSFARCPDCYERYIKQKEAQKGNQEENHARPREDKGEDEEPVLELEDVFRYLEYMERDVAGMVLARKMQGLAM